MFFGFTNFYKRFIKNFSRIAAPLISILRTTDNKTLSTQATRNEKNPKVPSGTTEAGVGGVDGSIENLSSSTKAKRGFGADFLTSGANKAFIQL